MSSQPIKAGNKKKDEMTKEFIVVLAEKSVADLKREIAWLKRHITAREAVLAAKKSRGAK